MILRLIDPSFSPQGLSRARFCFMDTQIKETLRSVGIIKIFDSPHFESFLNESTALNSKAKSLKIKNLAQSAHFSIHLTCLKLRYK